MGLLFSLTLIKPLRGGEFESSWEISGNAIMDFYYMYRTAEDVYQDFKTKDMQHAYFEGRSGFQFRRIYLTFEKELKEKFSTRLRMQMSNSTYTSSKMSATVKDAYLKWAYIDNHCLYLGISGSAAFKNLEKFWGYRLMEKTADDFFGIRSSREFGVALKGSLGNLSYHLQIGNGEGNKSEKIGEKDKLLSLALNYHLGEHCVLDIYGDKRVGQDTDYGSTAHIFAGYQSYRFRLGGNFTYQDDLNKDIGHRQIIRLWSIPLIINFRQNFSAIARFDYVHTLNPTDYKQYFVLIGFDFRLVPDIHFMPNLEYMYYDIYHNKGDADIIPRFTCSYEF